MVMVYDAETSDFLEDYCHTDNSLAYSSELSQSQNGMYYVFEKNREEGRSPEQAVIEAIEKYLPRVERFVPVNLNQYGMSDGWKSVAFYLLFAAIGIHAAFDAVSVLAAGALPVWLTEIVILVIALGIGAAGRFVWKKYHSDGVILE